MIRIVTTSENSIEWKSLVASAKTVSTLLHKRKRRLQILMVGTWANVRILIQINTENPGTRKTIVQILKPSQMSTKIWEAIEELKLELKYREKVYPRLIQEGKMSRTRARKRYKALMDTKDWLESVYTQLRATGHDKETILKSESISPRFMQGELNL